MHNTRTTSYTYMLSELNSAFIKSSGESSLLVGDALSLPLLNMGLGSVPKVVAPAISLVDDVMENGAVYRKPRKIHLA